VAKRNTGRRGRSRKRRASAQSAPQTAQSAPQQAAAPSRPATRGARRDAGSLAELQSYGERPPPPWHPLPLSELLIFVGGVGVVVAWLRGIQSEGALLAASIGAVVIGTVEVTLREHLSGYRSHTIMLAVIPAIVFHSAVVLLVLVISGHVPRWLNVVLLPIDAAIVAVFFKLLRARFVDARRERTFSGRR
jgi:hypothetical protein